MKDVAARAGVSTMTVSNVVNGRLKEMSEAKRIKVEQAIDALNYQVQASARSLRLDHQYTTCAVILDESRAFLSDVFISQVVAGLSNQLSEAGYALTIQGCPARDLSDALALRSHAYDGLFVIASGGDAHRRRVLSRLLSYHYPLVVFQETLTLETGDCCVVRQADAAGGEMLAAHLLERGCTSFLFLEPATRWPAIRARLAGFRKVARDHPRASVTVLRGEGEDFGATQKVLASHLATHAMPDAIVAANDRMAAAALKLLQDMGADVPDRTKVTGFNGFEASLYTSPALTTVISPAYELGEVAGREMLQRLTSGSFDEKLVELPVTFRPGGTT